MRTHGATSIFTAAIAGLTLSALPVSAESDWTLPPRVGTGGLNTGALNVVRDSGVDNTGRTDVTVKLNNIIGNAISRRWIYFPKGTYLVSGMVAGPFCSAGGTARGPVIVGESRTGTVIRLKDGTWPTSTFDPMQFLGVSSQVVLHGGDCGNTAFGKEIHNLTIDIGSNNDGATGVVFTTANYGGISNVNVVSHDGKGTIGVAVSGGEPGPCYASNIYVKGFKVGIYSNAADDVSIFQIRLEDQTRYGVLNAWGGEIDSLRFSTTTANVPAVFNRSLGRLVVMNGYFSGSSTGASVINQGGHFFARNINSAGYQGGAVSSTNTPAPSPAGATCSEYVSHTSQGLWYNPGRSMNLEVKYPPMPDWEQDTTKWIDVMRFKGGGIGGGPSRPDTTCFRMAWTSGRPNIEINGNKVFNITDTLFIEGNMERVMGTVGGIVCPAIVIRNNTPPVVVVQFLDYDGPIINRSSKTVIIQSVNGKLIGDGTGDLFVNGLMGRVTIRNPQQRAWVRDFNGEGQWPLARDSADIVVYNGQLWLMGYKTEGIYSKGNCFGGFLEMFGMLSYNTVPDQTYALFNIMGTGQFSLAVLTTVTHVDPPWHNLVRETRDGTMRQLTASTWEEHNPTLYTGYNCTNCGVVAAQRPAGKAPMASRFATALLHGTTLDVGLILDRAQPVSVKLLDMRGRAVCLRSSVGALSAGAHQYRYDLSSFASGAYCLNIKAADGAFAQRVLLAGSERR